ncbi:MAG: hypothetical protein U0931_31805 [Vulcanimicrobiota bacterium]
MAIISYTSVPVSQPGLTPQLKAPAAASTPPAPAPGERYHPEAGHPRSQTIPKVVQGLQENFAGPPSTHNGGPPLSEDAPPRQGSVPGSTTARPERGSYQIGSNPAVSPLRAQAAANAVLSDPLNPGGQPSRVLVSVQQNLADIQAGRGDVRFAGFEKRVANVNGVEIHYQYHPQQKNVVDLKDCTGSRPVRPATPAPARSSGPSQPRPQPATQARPSAVPARLPLGAGLRSLNPISMLLDAFRFGIQRAQDQEDERILNDPKSSDEQRNEILERRGLRA